MPLATRHNNITTPPHLLIDPNPPPHRYSIIISTSRPLHKVEEKELTRIQRETNIDPTKQILFDNTEIAMRSAKLYYNIFRRILDPSNLDQGNNNTTLTFST